LTGKSTGWKKVLMKYGNDSVLCFSELDGFLTAIVWPEYDFPNTWLSAIWGR
jgi:uncharacterized protein